MHFAVEHEFAGPAAEVMDAMVDPTLYLDLSLPDVGQPEVHEHVNEPGRMLLQLRYVFVGQLDPIARRLLGSAQLSWLQEIDLDAAEMTGQLTFASEDSEHRLQGAAAITFETTGHQTVRRIEGDLSVNVPVVASLAEARILGGLRQRLDIEADAIRARLAGN